MDSDHSEKNKTQQQQVDEGNFLKNSRTSTSVIFFRKYICFMHHNYDGMHSNARGKHFNLKIATNPPCIIIYFFSISLSLPTIDAYSVDDGEIRAWNLIWSLNKTRKTKLN